MLSHDAREAGFQSVTYYHLQPDLAIERERNYPLWVIAFWEQTVAIKDVIRKWVPCRDWLTILIGQKKSSERRKLAQKSSIILTSLPWGEKKPYGLADSLPIHTLWRYFGSSYLSCSEIDDTLALILTDLVNNPENMTTTQIEGSPFAMFLLDAYQDQGRYWDRRELAWLQTVGESLVNSPSGRLATIANLEPFDGQQHWVALVISDGGRKIEYGDSLAKKIPLLLWDVVKWWTCCHAPFLNPVLVDLPTIRQTDGHSCGILAVTALQDSFTLPSPSVSRDPVALRLELFNRVSNEILKRVSYAPRAHSQPLATTVTFIDHPENDISITVHSSPSIPCPINLPAIEEVPDIIGEASLESLPSVLGQKNRKSKLTDYWSVVTVEERRAKQIQESEKLIERELENEEKERQKRHQKQVQKLESHREAQRKYRERKRLAKTANKVNGVPEGRKRQKLNDSINDSSLATVDDSNDTEASASIFSHTTVAEISRPRCYGPKRFTQGS
ncbi:hypothetical protein AGABI1DRAFT_129326 [Agaricus bisporus var. burnettii JB137-S8]|uniref:Ubiquitin-like protease family profile domain-containing protein n=1 Tax=Agaricus bisporus var. burnettii (strain JB137-S8 / ATCC MYA-4627 / FGSC 10392) TaxID=597362 RepID=K5X5I5_AGABU|nr:uncharacterized protein AGABI1DRAFT_129326 [Agaricus bisporus var. burnettii JB137-S8]EKM78197.1 hypothetical protein AGABI1DRAFT_129326 [Agaricus bisporus var. burnettii JB137-S8]